MTIVVPAPGRPASPHVVTDRSQSAATLAGCMQSAPAMNAETPSPTTRIGRSACLAAGLLLILQGGAWAQAAPRDATPLEFASFFRQPVGPRGLEPGEALRAADGQTVRLVGYMVAQEQAQAGRFMLTPRPVRLSKHADGEADDLPPSTVTVLLDPGQQDRVVVHSPGLLALTGRLQVGRAEDPSGRVSWVRLLLGPQAVAGSALAAQPAGHTAAH